MPERWLVHDHPDVLQASRVADRCFQLLGTVLGPVLRCGYCQWRGATLRADPARRGWRWHCRRCGHSWRSIMPRT
jgi:hypothetical protein